LQQVRSRIRCSLKHLVEVTSWRTQRLGNLLQHVMFQLRHAGQDLGRPGLHVLLRDAAAALRGSPRLPAFLAALCIWPHPGRQLQLLRKRLHRPHTAMRVLGSSLELQLSLLLCLRLVLCSLAAATHAPAAAFRAARFLAARGVPPYWANSCNSSANACTGRTQPC